MLPLVKRLSGVLLLSMMIGGCGSIEPRGTDTDAERQASIARLVDVVRKDPSRKDMLARAVMSAPVLIIPDPNAKTLALLFFDQPERAFIPVFSSREIFDQEAYGTGFEGKAIAIDASRFASLLDGNEVVILNPGHRPAVEFSGAQLKAAAEK